MIALGNDLKRFIKNIDFLAERTDTGKGVQAQLRETIELYNMAEVLIVPSYAMKEFLLENGIKENMKFVIPSNCPPGDFQSIFN